LDESAALGVVILLIGAIVVDLLIRLNREDLSKRYRRKKNFPRAKIHKE
jgi:hypothetical protein